ncbi:MAG: 2-oxo acid dehydrogenase subunit E2 [Candidatus Krumholzibacteria bacterium]|nr:2-oxo acid dehydrogenase subunit E2 [Candidatus Krumholzibacteria bacterium]
MIKEVRLPEISENVEAGDVIKLLVAVGDVIEVDQPIVELETEKAVLEVPSPHKGKVTEILIAEGDTISIDQVILRMETDDAVVAQPLPDTVESSPPVEPAPAQESTPVAETPASRQRESSRSPVAPVPSAPSAESDHAASETPATTQARRATAPASPSLRRLARELGVDIRKVTGSGPGGRILKDDLTGYAKDVVSRASTVSKQSHSEGAQETRWGPVLREPMSKVRQVTARTMGQSWTAVPHVTQYDKVDITELEEIRQQYSAKIEATGGRLTLTAILLKVAASALKVFPQFNASIDMEKSEIVYKRYYDIGVAVDTDRGLLVPVVRAVDKKNIIELSGELNALAERARGRKLTPDEMDGGTFTISNLGGIGGTNFSPIVYAPQVAILGVARARTEAVHLHGRFEPRLILPLSVSYDHRIIDGADGARFLRWVVRALEEPLVLALEG